MAVMLSAGFVHLLGESVMELEDVTQFPLATFLCGVGFLVTLLADSVMEVMSGGKGNPTGTPTAALCCGALPALLPDTSTPLHHINVVADGELSMDFLPLSLRVRTHEQSCACAHWGASADR